MAGILVFQNEWLHTKFMNNFYILIFDIKTWAKVIVTICVGGPGRPLLRTYNNRRMDNFEETNDNSLKYQVMWLWAKLLTDLNL